jgi:hypothetical protein
VHDVRDVHDEGDEVHTTPEQKTLNRINSAPGPGGERFEALGSDALQQWMIKNAIDAHAWIK